MDKISFKERVKLNSIKYSKIYKEKFVDKEDLLFSNAFKNDKYYILRAHENNYLHLIGVHTTLNPIDFFNKCLNGSLSENDFDFIFKNKEEKMYTDIIIGNQEILDSFLLKNNEILYKK